MDFGGLLLGANLLEEHEVWAQYTGSIKAFHGLIMVSNMGRVFKRGTNTSKNMSRILKGTKNAQGYMRLHISINGKVYNKPIHRLVAEMFCPNPNNKPYVDHINAQRDDNRACNLQWVTHAENCQNPHYTQKLKARISEQLRQHNHLKEALKKPVVAEHRDGTILHFNSINELKDYFHAQSNVKRIIQNNRFVKSSKSPLKGWRVQFADSVA